MPVARFGLPSAREQGRKSTNRLLTSPRSLVDFKSTNQPGGQRKSPQSRTEAKMAWNPPVIHDSRPLPSNPRIGSNQLPRLDDRTRRTQLPLEIIYDIIGISVPPPRSSNRDRLDFLLPLCLVHRSFRHVILRLPHSVELLAAALEENSGFGRAIVSLRLGDPDNEEEPITVDLARILVHCAELKEVWLFSVNRVYIKSLSLSPSTFDDLVRGGVY